MKTTTTPTLLLLAAVSVAGCDTTEGGGLEPPEFSLGREIIETFAEYVGEDPSDIRVRSGAWDDLSADHPVIAEAVRKYVEQAGIGFPAWSPEPGEIGPPPVPRVIGFFSAKPYFAPFTRPARRPGIQIWYGSGPQPCYYGMVVERLKDGEWHVGTTEIRCHDGVLP